MSHNSHASRWCTVRFDGEDRGLTWLPWTWVRAEAAPQPLSEEELDAQDPKELQYRRALQCTMLPGQALRMQPVGIRADACTMQPGSQPGC